MDDMQSARLIARLLCFGFILFIFWLIEPLNKPIFKHESLICTIVLIGVCVWFWYNYIKF